MLHRSTFQMKTYLCVPSWDVDIVILIQDRLLYDNDGSRTV